MLVTARKVPSPFPIKIDTTCGKLPLLTGKSRIPFPSKSTTATKKRTINAIGAHYGVHPNLAPQWKSRPPWSLPDIFSTRRERDAQGEEALKAELYKQIGQLKVELDWLKKKAGLLD